MDGNGNAQHFHRLNDATCARIAAHHTQRTAKVAAQVPAAELAVRDRVYRALLDAAPLSEAHRAALTARGMTAETMVAGRFGTLPDRGRKRAELAAQVQAATGLSKAELLSVPGFYNESRSGEGGELAVAGAAGLLVPVFVDTAGHVGGCQIRPDTPAPDGPKYLWLSSTSQGGPGAVLGPHVPPVVGELAAAEQGAQGDDKPVRVVRLTEGPIKAALAQQLTGIRTVAVPGVSTWATALPVLAECADAVVLSFDADWSTNPRVAGPLVKCARKLVGRGHEFRLETWDGSDGRKGIDDLLAAGAAPGVARGLSAVRTMRQAAAQHNLRVPVDADDVLPWARLYVAQADGPELYEDRDLLDAVASMRADPDKAGAVAQVIWTVKQAAWGSRFQKTVDELVKAQRNAAEQRRAAAKAQAQAKPDEAQGDGTPYREQGGCLYLVGRDQSGGEVETKIANFTARIVAQVQRHLPGGEVRRVLRIAATHCDGKRGETMVDGADYEAMGWLVGAFGGEFSIAPGRGTRDHVRYAIQVLSHRDCIPNGIPNAVEHTATGWIVHEGRNLYVHAGGAIDADGPTEAVRVDLHATLAKYRLPADPTDPVQVRAAVTACTELLDLGAVNRPGARAIAAALAGLPWRAVLGTFNSALHFSGTTGSRKTSAALLAVQHFGPEHDNVGAVPSSWDSTGAALQGALHAARDSLLLVDDLVADGPDAERTGSKASSVFTSQGNGSGRQRCKPDGTPAGEINPRGSLLSTGETDPPRRSARGRSLVVPFTPSREGGSGGSVDLDALTKLQKYGKAGLFAQAMAAYVRWLATGDNLATTRAELVTLTAELAKDAAKHRAAAGVHSRHPGAVAELAAAYRLFLRWAVSVGAISEDQARSHQHEQWVGLMDLLAAQAHGQLDADPGLRFLVCLKAAISSQKAYVVDSVTIDVPDGFEVVAGWHQELKWQGNENGQVLKWAIGPNATQVGWLHRDEQTGAHKLWLNRKAAFQAANVVARSEGFPLGDERSVWARLGELGIIPVQRRRATDPSVNYSVRRYVRGRREEVAEIVAEVFWPSQASDEAQAQAQADEAQADE